MKRNKEKSSTSKIPLIITILFIAGLILSYFIFDEVRDFFHEAFEVLTSEDEQKITQWVSQFGWWGPAVIVLTMILQMFALVIPSPLLMVISVLAYGPVFGTIINIIAITAASTLGYALGLLLGKSFVSKLISKEKEVTIRKYLDKYGFWAVFVTRFTPFLSNDAISFVTGILRMGYLKFIGATILGISPLALIIAYLGETNERLMTGLIIVSIIAILALIWYIINDRRKEKQSNQ